MTDILPESDSIPITSNKGKGEVPKNGSSKKKALGTSSAKGKVCSSSEVETSSKANLLSLLSSSSPNPDLDDASTTNKDVSSTQPNVEESPLDYNMV